MNLHFSRQYKYFTCNLNILLFWGKFNVKCTFLFGDGNLFLQVSFPLKNRNRNPLNYQESNLKLVLYDFYPINVLSLNINREKVKLFSSYLELDLYMTLI